LSSLAVSIYLLLLCDVQVGLADETGHRHPRWPETLTVQARALDSPAGSPLFETTCPVEGSDARRVAHCLVAPGEYDLRIQADGFVPHYTWSAHLPPAGLVELSDFSLRRGAWLVGQVLLEDGEPAEGAAIALEPSIADANARTALAGEIETFRHQGATEARGHFQLGGLSAGAYDLHATVPDFGTARRARILVSEPAEHRLDAPLTVPYFPRAELAVSPPQDVGGRPWTIRLLGNAMPHQDAEADGDGRVVFDLLPAGDYFLIVEDGAGQRWIARDQRFSPETPRAEVTIEGVPVVGTVTLDGEPLAAALHFGGRTGVESVRLDSGPDGEFVGLLPRQGDWTLEVRSDSPTVRWTRYGFPVEVDAGLGAAELTIDLPATSVSGRVTEPDGRPVYDAGVLLSPTFPEGRLVQVSTDEDGAFEVAGQMLGEYRVKAIDSGMRSSPVETISLSETEPDATLDLVLHESREIDGQVVGADGTPVPGATVSALRRLDAPPGGAMFIPQAYADIEGRFRLTLPPGGAWQGVAVLAPGHVLGLGLLPPEGEPGDWLIRLDSRGGGELALTGLERDAGRVFPAAALDGMWRLDFGVLSRWARYQGSPAAPDRLTVPNLPSGSYTICIPTSSPPEECQGGLLSAQGRLTIDFQE
jgi:hypothetical protein